ncbi:hypothetical protein C8J56DRAFT_1102955 [Mycena floridula]|nr:hypothetical protein C8J56DRAFT_1102955 [Mycena floridula]
MDLRSRRLVTKAGTNFVMLLGEGCLLDQHITDAHRTCRVLHEPAYTCQFSCFSPSKSRAYFYFALDDNCDSRAWNFPVVIRGLTEPQPYGADGDSMGPDHNFEQKSISLLRTYTVDCKGDFTSADKSALKTWVDQQIAATPGGQDEVGLAEQWGISQTEMTEFIG